MNNEHPVCDRCGKTVDGWIDDDGSAGCYVVTSELWSPFSNPGEKVVCDNCMWTDPRYIEKFGEQPLTG